MKFTGHTNQKQYIQCESNIKHVTWRSVHASEGERIKLDIGTSFVGMGSEMKLVFSDKRGSKNEQGVVATIVAAMDENDYLRLRIHQGNGGEVSFQEWVSADKPVELEVEYPVSIPDKLSLFDRVLATAEARIVARRFETGIIIDDYGNVLLQKSANWGRSKEI